MITVVAYQLKQMSHAAAWCKMLSVVGVNQFWCVAAVTVQTEQQNSSLMSTTPITTHKVGPEAGITHPTCPVASVPAKECKTRWQLGAGADATPAAAGQHAGRQHGATRAALHLQQQIKWSSDSVGCQSSPNMRPCCCAHSCCCNHLEQ